VVVLSCYETTTRGPFELTLATNAGGSAGAPLYNKKYFSLKEVRGQEQEGSHLLVCMCNSQV
jgi:hypothetical protein